MKPTPLTNDFREDIEHDAMEKLSLLPRVEAAHAAALAVRAAYLDIVAATVKPRDMLALRRHGCCEFVSSLTVRVPKPPREGRNDETRAIHVSFMQRKPNGEDVFAYWRKPADPAFAVWAVSLWLRSPGYSVSSNSGGEKMPEPMRAALAPLALAYDAAVEEIHEERQRHRETLRTALAECKSVEQAERVWPGTAALAAERAKVRRAKNEEDYRYRERLRVRCLAIPVGLLAAGEGDRDGAPAASESPPLDPP